VKIGYIVTKITIKGMRVLNALKVVSDKELEEFIKREENGQ